MQLISVVSTAETAAAAAGAIDDFVSADDQVAALSCTIRSRDRAQGTPGRSCLPSACLARTYAVFLSWSVWWEGAVRCIQHK